MVTISGLYFSLAILAPPVVKNMASLYGLLINLCRTVNNWTWIFPFTITVGSKVQESKGWQFPKLSNFRLRDYLIPG